MVAWNEMVLENVLPNFPAWCPICCPSALWDGLRRPLQVVLGLPKSLKTHVGPATQMDFKTAGFNRSLTLRF